MAADDKFCIACGIGVSVGDGGVRAQDPLPSTHFKTHENQAKIGRARKWLFAISLLTLLSGFIFFFIQRDKTEHEIADAERVTAHMDPGERDEAMKAEIGMTFQEAIDHDRGMVKLMFAINIALSVLYLGMWLWAKKNALAASTTAFLLFVTTIVVNAVVEPETIYQGLIVKIFFTIALVKAIQAASEERKLTPAP